MKVKITKEEFEALGAGWEPHYLLQADGSYKLNVEGAFLDDQDPQVLKNALERVRKEKEEIGLKLKALEDTKTQSQLEAEKLAAEEKQKAMELAIKNKDLESLTKTFDEKLAAQQKAFEEQIAERDKATESRLAAMKESAIKEKANSIATEIFGEWAPTQIANLLPSLDVDEANNVIAKDENGNVLSIDAFKKSIVDSPMFKPIIVASRASGAGGTQSDKGSPVDTSNRSFDDLSSGERVALQREDPAKYSQLQKTATKVPIKL